MRYIRKTCLSNGRSLDGSNKETVSEDRRDLAMHREVYPGGGTKDTEAGRLEKAGYTTGHCGWSSRMGQQSPSNRAERPRV